MKNQKLDFMKYQYEEIGTRIKEYRISQGLGQDDFSEIITNKIDYKEKEVSIQANVMSSIENGKIFGKNKNFLPDKTLQILSEVLKKSKVEIIFGNETDLKSFVMKLYYQIVVNIHPVLLGDSFPAYMADIFPKLEGFLIDDDLEEKNPTARSQQVSRLTEKHITKRISRSRQILTPCNTIRVKTMAMQTWLVLLLCIFFFSISVYSFISYLKDRRRQKLTFNDKRSMRRK